MNSRHAVDALAGAAESLLLPLYSRALESARPHPILRDEHAARLVASLDYDFARLEHAQLYHTIICLRARRIDALVTEFLERSPDGLIVNFGCGLDTRFARVDNGRATWVDVDLPEPLELRRRLVGDEARRRLLVSDDGLRWLADLLADWSREVLFVAEGVLMFLAEGHVRRLVGSLAQHAPGAEMVFDAVKPVEVWARRFHPTLSGTGARLRFGLWSGSSLEAWEPGLRVLGEWFYCEEPEPRLGSYRLLRFMRRLACTAFVVHAALSPASGMGSRSRRSA